MLNGSNSTPLPTTVVDVAASPANGTATGIPTMIINRLMTLRASNPFNGVSNAAGVLHLLRKETPKLLDPRGYSKPASVDQAFSRIRANVAFFRVTYATTFIAVVLLFILSNPTLFLSVILLLGLWSAFLSQPPEHVLQLGSVELKRNEKLVILGSLTVLVVVFGGLISSAIYIFGVSGFLIGTHGALREPIVLDALEQLEREGESIVKGDVV